CGLAGLRAVLFSLCAILLAACPGIGTSIYADNPYGINGTGTSSDGASDSASGQSPGIDAGDLLKLSNTGDVQAIITLFTTGDTGAGGMSDSGTTELVFSAADIGLPNGGSVTLSITGRNIAYEKTAEADTDGNVTFTVPFLATGAAVTVKVTVTNVFGRVIWVGSRQQTVAEDSCDVAVTLSFMTPEDFVYVEGNGTTQNFYICNHEVTQAEYETFCSYSGSSPSAAYGIGPNYPAYAVSWYNALVYCNRRSMADGLTPVYTISGSTDPADWGTVPTSSDATWNAVSVNARAGGYRLPTEAEWDYAAKGGKANDSYTYSGSNDIEAVAWYNGNSGIMIHPVKSKAANSLGIYDMSGNVWERCFDWFDTSNIVRRGGCGTSSASGCTVLSGRGGNPPNHLGVWVGFRVVCNAN
ncbi:MAG: formylglycine-generating enzyme family protein, partial [Treponema sp.]|nr:formylglycine-generating enzyme family protein [Treponema sp.]